MSSGVPNSPAHTNFDQLKKLVLPECAVAGGWYHDDSVGGQCQDTGG